MPLRDRLYAALVAVCWGLNFPATAIALEHYPPLLMVAMRFTLLAIPTMILVPRPQVPLRWLIGTALAMNVMQFSFLYLAMAAGMPSGLASLVLQASAPFTVLIAGFWLRERITRRQLVGIAFAVLGLAAIAVYRAQVAALLPVVLTLCGALGWGLGNVCSRRAQAPKPLHFTLWMSVVPPIPMFLLSLTVEGWDRIRAALTTAFTRSALPADLGLLYVVLIATVVGYGLWNSLLARHPSNQVAPFSMLVPIVGVLSSWLIFGELIPLPELIAGAAVVGGVLYASRPGRRPPAPVEGPPVGVGDRIGT